MLLASEDFKERMLFNNNWSDDCEGQTKNLKLECLHFKTHDSHISDIARAQRIIRIIIIIIIIRRLLMRTYPPCWVFKAQKPCRTTHVALKKSLLILFTGYFPTKKFWYFFIITIDILV